MSIDIIKGRIEAFEFAANQFEVYADDADGLLSRRLYTLKKRREIETRCDCWRGMAKELREYAAEQRKAIE